MKIYTFYFLILIPFILLIFLGIWGDSYLFMILILVYAVLYRPFIHILRLVSLNVIQVKEGWKLFIPIIDLKYFKKLYLG